MLPKAKLLKNIFALDFGTTKFCLATIAEVPGTWAGGQGSVSVQMVSVPADGMRRGMLANLVQAKAALKQLLEQAERQFGVDIMRVVVGVAGSHLGSRMVSGSCDVEGDTVTDKDMAKLISRVEASSVLEGRELLHTVPVGYRVDERETVDDPRGFRGQQLRGDFFMIDADRLYLRDIIDVCNDCGLQVEHLYSEPFASASVTVPDSYKELGVACADIGGGTTDGIVFRGGRPVGAFTVNVAGKLMTNDLAIGLGVGPEEAEKVKLCFGIKPRPGEMMEVRDLRAAPKLVTAVQVKPILLPRIHELCGLVARELLPYRGTLGAGLLLTGGGADVKGITQYFQARLGVPVARAKPALVAPAVVGDGSAAGKEQALARATHATKYATVIGLLNLELCRVGDLHKTRKSSWSNRYLGQFFNWIKELS